MFHSFLFINRNERRRANRVPAINNPKKDFNILLHSNTKAAIFNGLA
jgi:hypothetical protein